MDVTEADLDRMDAVIERRKAQTYARTAVSAGLRKEKQFDHHGAEKKRRELVQAKDANLERVIKMEYEAWRLKTLGKSIYEISSILGVPLPQVSIWLADALAQVRKATAELIEIDHEIELSRTELLLAHYMPMALMDNVVLERIRQGEPIAEDDWDRPQRAAWVVIELIKLRCKIKGITQTDADRALVPAVDLLSWLRTQREFITRTVEAAPSDVLTLEVDNPIDENEKPQTQTQQSPEGIPDAL